MYTEMNYNDIKHIVVGTTHNLDMVPTSVVSDLWGSDSWTNLVPDTKGKVYLTGIEHPRITCVTHAYMPALSERSDMEVGMYHDGWTIKHDQQRVCTILVDGVPAFFFVHVWPEERWAPHTDMYTLSHWKCTLFLLLITGQNAVARHVFPITDTDQVDALVETNGVKITYGSISP